MPKMTFNLFEKDPWNWLVFTWNDTDSTCSHKSSGSIHSWQGHIEEYPKTDDVKRLKKSDDSQCR